MNNYNFAKEFHFTQYERHSNYHTDNSTGAHSHCFGYMLEGQARFVSDTEDFTINSGELVYIPKHISYQSYWFASPSVKFISLAFGVFPDCQQRRYTLQKININDDIRGMIMSVPLNHPVDCGAVGQLYMMLDKLLPKMSYKQKKPADGIIGRATEYMAVDPHLTIGEIAKRCGISESGLYAAFRENGTTPVDTRQRLLCEKAIALLTSTTMTVEDIAYTLGFSTPAYFRRVLRKQYGKTPSEIRRNLPI